MEYTVEIRLGDYPEVQAVRVTPEPAEEAS